MATIVNFGFNKIGLEDIRHYRYGINWPVVYIIYNSKYAYVGETLDLYRRTEQHLYESKFKRFEKVCLITHKTFNKSTILHLESFLIKYISADGKRKLINRNDGIVEHNYFYKDFYQDYFREIWDELVETGLVKKSLEEIENSEIYKYSPYKSLNEEQLRTAYKILEDIIKLHKPINKNKSLIQITGSVGTGKTILAVYLVKLIVDIVQQNSYYNVLDDFDSYVTKSEMSKELNWLSTIGFVVPMKSLRTAIKVVFKSIDGLSQDMVLSPEEVVKKKYDLLIVDEAHRLYKRNSLTSSSMYKKFDAINANLMNKKPEKDEDDYTQLDWIIKSSKYQILFYDRNQSIRKTDIGHDRYSKIIENHIFDTHNLSIQMRCQTNEDYCNYIRDILTNSCFFDKRKDIISNYDIKIFDNVDDLSKSIILKNNDWSLCRLVTGPGWSKTEKVKIDNKEFVWSDDISNPKGNSIYSVHSVQGFDLNYVGVVFGREIYYDLNTKSVRINKKFLKDNRAKDDDNEIMREYVINIYTVLLTRGIKGTYLYAYDKELSKYLKQFF